MTGRGQSGPSCLYTVAQSDRKGSRRSAGQTRGYASNDCAAVLATKWTLGGKTGGSDGTRTRSLPRDRQRSTFLSHSGNAKLEAKKFPLLRQFRQFVTIRIGQEIAARRQPASKDIPILDHVIRNMLGELAAEGGPPVYTLTPAEARNVLLRAQSGSVRKPDVQIKDWNVQSGQHALRLRTVRPATTTGRRPVIMYFHGAGWVMGDATTHDRLVRELAVGANATMVFLDYDRASEHRYPVAIEEAYAATSYVPEHPEEFEVDATRLAVAGDSVGGNMATVVCLFSKQRSGPRIAGQLLFYPVTNADLRPARTSNWPMAHGLHAVPCSGFGTNIFLITPSARSPRLPATAGTDGPQLEASPPKHNPLV